MTTLPKTPPAPAVAIKSLEWMAEALGRFASFAEFAVDEVGWVNNYGRERIHDWLGPTEFREARAVLDAYNARKEQKL